MDPFQWGADYIMHSATKYFGGHSDLLAGVIVTKSEQYRNKVTPWESQLTVVIRRSDVFGKSTRNYGVMVIIAISEDTSFACASTIIQRD